MVSLLFFFNSGLAGGFKVVGLMAAVFFVVSALSGLDLGAIFSAVKVLIFHYAEELGYKEFSRALDIAPLGKGTGMNTIAARYAFPDTDSGTIGIENYYGKVIVELGIVGVFVFVLLEISLIATALRIFYRAESREIRGAVSSLATFFIVVFISNIKSFRMDYDPINMYYWIFAGILFRFNSLVKVARQ